MSHWTELSIVGRAPLRCFPPSGLCSARKFSSHRHYLSESTTSPSIRAKRREQIAAGLREAFAESRSTGATSNKENTLDRRNRSSTPGNETSSSSRAPQHTKPHSIQQSARRFIRPPRRHSRPDADGGGDGGYEHSETSRRSRTQRSRTARQRGPDQNLDAGEEEAGSGEQERTLTVTQREYLEEKERATTAEVPFSPETVDMESLRAYYPALPSSNEGLAATLQEHMNKVGAKYPGASLPTKTLAQRVFKGQDVMFASEAEKDETLQLTNELAAKRAERLLKHRDITVQPGVASFEPIDELQREQLTRTLVQGNYPQSLGKDAQGTIRQALAAAWKNKTFTRNDEATFAKKLRQIMGSGAGRGRPVRAAPRKASA